MSETQGGAGHRPGWWAGLTDEAITDEILAGRRTERLVALAGVVGVVLTALALVVVAVAR